MEKIQTPWKRLRMYSIQRRHEYNYIFSFGNDSNIKCHISLRKERMCLILIEKRQELHNH